MRVEHTVATGKVQGECQPEFLPVWNAFVANFTEREEVGASLCIKRHGETVLDVWGGEAAPDRAWEADTVSVVFSCTKAATALAAHHLVDRGLLALQAPIAEYWPEFAVAGKSKATVAMALNHSVGVPALRAPLEPGGFLQWDYMVERIAAEAPFWEPGTRHGYHMATFGWTVGELVRRVAGSSLGQYFRTAIAEPLGIDFWIGLPEGEEHRVAPIIEYRPSGDEPANDFIRAIREDRESIPALAVLNRGGLKVNSRAAHAAELGAGGGITNARGLAGMFAPLADCGGSLLSSATVARMAEVSSASSCDATLMIPTRFALGFMKSMDNRYRPSGHIESAVLGASAFGHVGAGGSIGFADPDSGLSFGYTMNRMGAGLLLNERGQHLVDAAYTALGYRDSVPGVWRR
ncbi:MAG: beta-lactamase family protein [Gammaproteobacteria bacterium]|nr:beta-lactamase family protein [Gammaproteobacteria bacterium]